ncbi:unnamed protein product [Heligmosomoides polygyrus]|uniref:Aldo_ket_red domain-containing protein n=1 Tax=Heligmosomoides polygyrus TaxID=6339 RepID=A0A3P8A9E2_HELPZ|nr:unnamed protein product [Heligmosomoides polygyrus]
MSKQNLSVTVQDIWCGLEGVYAKGLAKAIGVSNWSIEQIERVMKIAKVPIHNCQVECHLYWPQHELHDTCKKYNISFTSYASLGSPGRVKCQPKGMKIHWAPAPNAFEDPHVKELAKKYSKTPAQLFDFALTVDDIKLLESTKHRQRLFMQEFFAGHPEDPYKTERKH